MPDEGFYAGNVASKRNVLLRVFQSLRGSGKKLTITLLFGGATAAIAFNAMVLQPARHPAPLFAMVDAARAVSEKGRAPVSTNAAAPARREASAEKAADDKMPAKSERTVAERPVEKTDRPAPKIVQPAPAPAAPIVAAARPPVRSQGTDALGELIRGGVLPPAPIPVEADARLLSIQKNLVRLGFQSGKPDGLMGPGTRTAIEKFERSKKWPVTGEISAQLVRELGTVSAKRD